MEQTPEPRRRLNIVGKAARRKRIFDKLREGWAYDEIAREERVSAERIRQIVSEVLGKRVIDRGGDHAHLQLERLMPALRLVGEAIGRGELKAVAPLIKQTVRKVGVSGFLRIGARARIAHDLHCRIRARSAAVAARGGGRLRRR